MQANYANAFDKKDALLTKLNKNLNGEGQGKKSQTEKKSIEKSIIAWETRVEHWNKIIEIFEQQERDNESNESDAGATGG